MLPLVGRVAVAVVDVAAAVVVVVCLVALELSVSLLLVSLLLLTRFLAAQVSSWASSWGQLSFSYIALG